MTEVIKPKRVRKKVVKPVETEALGSFSFGPNVFVLTKVGEVFWGVCPLLGDTYTVHESTREDLINRITQNTGFAAVPYVRKRNLIFQDDCYKLYDDGSLYLTSSYFKAKFTLKIRTGYGQEFTSDLKDRLNGIGSLSEASEEYPVRIIPDRVRFTIPGKPVEEISCKDIPAKVRNHEAYYLDEMLYPILHMLGTECTELVDMLCRSRGTEVDDWDTAGTRCPNAFSKHLALIYGMVEIYENPSYCVEIENHDIICNFQTVSEIDDWKSEILTLAEAIGSL